MLAPGNQGTALTNTFNVIVVAPEDRVVNWVQALSQAGLAPQISLVDSIYSLKEYNKPIPWQLALCYEALPGAGSQDILPAIRAMHPTLPVIIIARQATVEDGVAAIKAGASHYMDEANLANLGPVVRQALAETHQLETTQALRKQDELRYYQMFKNNSAIKLLIDPTTGAIFDCNEAACRFYGYSPEELTNLNIEAINTLSQEEIKAEMEIARSDERLYFEFRHRLASGEIRDVEVRTSPIELDGKTLLYSVVFDITERKFMEQAQSFLVTISHLLNTTLDYRAVLKDVVQASVPFLADVCLVFLIGPDDSIKLQTLAALEDGIEERFRWWFEDHPATLSDKYGVGRALRNKTYQLIKNVDPQLLGESGLNPAQIDFYIGLDLKSILIVPLMSQDRLQGAMVFLYRESDRHYTDWDLKLAETIARRVGLAMDNARHYEEARLAAEAEMATRRELEALASLLTQQANELNAIIEAMPDGVFICDEKGKLTRINPRGRQILGLNEKEDLVEQVGRMILYHPNGQLIKPEERPLPQALRGIIQTDFHEMLHHPVTGEIVQLRISFAPIRNSTGEIRGAVAIVSDITELQRLENQKEEFLTIASHELKTPITSIKGLTQLAIRSLTRAGQTKEVANLRSVEKQVERLIELINDMLDTRRVQHGKLELNLRPFDFAAMARETCQALQATTTVHSITIEAPPELIVTGDSHRLEQVLNNLLSNAIKYSPRGGPIEVTLERRDNSTYLSVHDSGIGVPPQDRENLFQPFHRASNVSLFEVAGFGLGLYLCSEIMKAHNGRLWLEESSSPEGHDGQAGWDEQAANSGVTTPQTGSLFCISLPME
jgi:PAS domain S-box-containing protein